MRVRACSNNRASTICHALLASGLREHFEFVMDTQGRIYRPRKIDETGPQNGARLW